MQDFAYSLDMNRMKNLLKLSLFTNLIYQLNAFTLVKQYSCCNLRPAANILRGVNVKDPVAEEYCGDWNDIKYGYFMENFWQRRPLLIRKAIDVEKELKISYQDLYHLSTHDDVESRSITRRNLSWRKEYGPFNQNYFSSMGSGNWTLLVQEVDRHIPYVADIWDKHFNFIPTWRRDDIMMSYATPGGGIGAHVDSYDVFLLQAR